MQITGTEGYYVSACSNSRPFEFCCHEHYKEHVAAIRRQAQLDALRWALARKPRLTKAELYHAYARLEAGGQLEEGSDAPQ